MPTTGKVGKAYGATNTPNMFVIDKTGTVVNAGAIDNSRDGEGKSPQGGKLINHVDAALDDVAAGRPVGTLVGTFKLCVCSDETCEIETPRIELAVPVS